MKEAKKKEVSKRDYNALKTKVRNAIRISFARSKMYKEFMHSFRIPIDFIPDSVKSEFPRTKFFYQCPSCKKISPWQVGKESVFNIDHIIPVGRGSFNSLEDTVSYFHKVYDYGNLQLLCIDCHKDKTKEENKAHSASKKLPS